MKLRSALLTLGIILISHTAGASIVVISWDGNARRHIEELMFFEPSDWPGGMCPNGWFDPIAPTELAPGDFTCMPNFRELNYVHATLNPEATGGNCLTYPGHTKMLSGYDAFQTGVVTQDHGRLPDGTSLYEQICAQYGVGHFYMSHIAGRKFASGGIIRMAKRWRGSVIQSNGSTRKERCLTRAKGRGGTFRQAGTNEVRKTIESYQRYADGRPSVIFIHHKFVDVSGHRSGTKLRYIEGMVHQDVRLGEIRAAFPGHEILITTDHGFNDHGTFHHCVHGPLVTDLWIATTLPISDNRNHEDPTQPWEMPMITDVTPTVLDSLGVDSAQSKNIIGPPSGVSLLIH
jgi:hypothetical protein